MQIIRSTLQIALLILSTAIAPMVLNINPWVSIYVASVSFSAVVTLLIDWSQRKKRGLN